MKLKSILFLYIFFLAIINSYHQSHGEKTIAPTTLTWIDSLKQAQQHHPQLQAKKERIKQATLGIKVAKSPLYPQLSIQSSLSNRHDSNYTLSAQQQLFDGFKTSSQIQQMNWQLELAHNDYNKQSAVIRRSIKLAFISILENMALVQISKAIRKRRQQNYNLVSLRYEAGREHRGSLLTANANLAQAKLDEIQAKNNLHIAHLVLSKELGFNIPQPIKVIGSFSSPILPSKKPDFISIAKQNTQNLHASYQEKIAHHTINILKSDYYPHINASFNTGNSFKKGLPNQDDWTLFTTLSMNLFDGFKRKNSLEQAKSSLKESQANTSAVLMESILTLEKTWARLQESIEQVAVAKLFFKAASERSKISEAQYSIGLISFDNWIIIEDSLVHTQKSVIQAIARALRAEADFIFSKGVTIENEI